MGVVCLRWIVSTNNKYVVIGDEFWSPSILSELLIDIIPFFFIGHNSKPSSSRENTNFCHHDMTRFREHRGIDVFEGRRLITRAMVNYWKAWEEIGTSRFTMKMHRLIHGPFSSKCQKNSNAIKSKGEIWIGELTYYSFMEHTPRKSKQIKDLWWTARLLSKIPPFYGSNQHARFLIKSPWNHMTSNFEQEHYNYTTSSSSSSQLLHDPCKMLKSKRRNLKVFEDLFQDIYVCVCILSF